MIAPRRAERAIVALISLAVALTAGPASAAIRAVFVGVDRYAHSRQHDPKATPAFDDMQVAGADVIFIKRRLARAYGLALDPGPLLTSTACDSRNGVSITLTDACATRPAILAALEQQLAAAHRGDTILFYFSGLGSEAGTQATILASDARDPKGPPGDIETRLISDTAARANARGINMLSLIDACQPAPHTPWVGYERGAPPLPRALSSPARRQPPRRSSGARGHSLTLALHCTDAVTNRFGSPSYGRLTDEFGDMIKARTPWLMLGPGAALSAGAKAPPPPWKHASASASGPDPLGGRVFLGPDGTVLFDLSISTGVVGGYAAKPGEAPWMVELSYLGKLRPGFVESATTRHACGAILIEASWVLTAAHCLPTDETGAIEVDAVSKQMNARLGGNALASLEPIAIDKAYPHPDFCDATVHPDRCAVTVNDLALLHLAAPAPMNDPEKVQALGLPDVTETLAAGSPVSVMGWGAVSEAGAEDHVMTAALRIGDMAVVDGDDCARRNREAGGQGFNNPLPDTILCASVAGAKVDACQGDSGGPLVFHPEFAGEVVGIVSSGLDCAVAPGLYSRVAPFRPWINTVMNAVALDQESP